MEGEDRFTLSFFMRNPELKIERQFNMMRPLSEPSAAFLHRLNANVDKVVAKKRKKKAKKAKMEEKQVSRKQLFLVNARFGSDYPRFLERL